jgi:cytoskeletal protein RodZ
MAELLTDSNFGSFLREARLAKNASLEAVSQLTRISMSNLRFIEIEDLANLPPPVFVKGFLRAYAQAIGVDEKEVLKRYEVKCNEQKHNKRDRTHRHSPRKKWSRYFTITFAIFLFIAGILSLSLYSHSPMKGNESLPKSDKVIDEKLNGSKDIDRKETLAENKTDPKMQEEKVGSGSPELTLSGQSNVQSLTLQISAVETARVKVITDAKKPQELNLKPGDQVQLTAESHFSLLINNAAGVRLAFNGQEVSVPGVRGQTVTLQLPQERSRSKNSERTTTRGNKTDRQ